MALSITDIVTGIQTLLVSNNTTTSTHDISNGLTKRVQKFYKGAGGMNEVYPVPNVLYPVVFVELNSKSEDWAQIGRASAKRNIILNCQIVCVTNYGAGTGTESTSGQESASYECIKLTQNIEKLLRNNIDLGLSAKGVQWNLNTDTDFTTRAGETFNSVSISRCQIKILSD